MKKFLMPICFALIFLWTGGALAEDKKKEEPIKTTDAAVAKTETTEKTVVSDGKEMFQSFKGGKYREAIAITISLIIFFWRRFLSAFIINKLSPWWVGFVTVLLGYLGTMPEMLAAKDFSWSTFVWAGLITSGQAMLVWQMIGKKILPTVFGELTKP